MLLLSRTPRNLIIISHWFALLVQILCRRHTDPCLQKQQGYRCALPRLEASGDLQHNLERRELGYEWRMDEAELDLQSFRGHIRIIWCGCLSCTEWRHEQLYSADQQLVGTVGVSNIGCSSSQWAGMGAEELPSLWLLRRPQAQPHCTTRMCPKSIIGDKIFICGLLQVIQIFLVPTCGMRVVEHCFEEIGSTYLRGVNMSADFSGQLRSLQRPSSTRWRFHG